MNNHALKEQKEMAMNYRNIGLGIMGEHDALIKMGMKYGSKESIDFIDSIMGLMFRSSVIASSRLAKEKGCFPKYKDTMLLSSIIVNHFSLEDLKTLGITKYGLRNCSLLSIAPSGSIGTMLNISTGCEPHFRISYQRRTESLNGGEDKIYNVYVDVANEYMKATGKTELPDYFISSEDINWRDRVMMQSVLQNHVDTAISSTVNLPNETTKEEIEQLYLFAWEKGLKGVTIFRDGCARLGILTTDKKEHETEYNATDDTLKRGQVVKIGNDSIGKERHLNTGCGTLHVGAFFDSKNGELLEVYLSKGSKGGCQSNLGAVSRLISLAARGGISVYDIVDQLESCLVCPSYAVRNAKYKDVSKGSSCPSAVGYALIEMYKEMQDDLKNCKCKCRNKEVDTNKESAKKEVRNPCPECGEELAYEGGCNICKNCGYTKCD